MKRIQYKPIQTKTECVPWNEECNAIFTSKTTQWRRLLAKLLVWRFKMILAVFVLLLIARLQSKCESWWLTLLEIFWGLFALFTLFLCFIDFFLLICWIWIIFSHNSCFYADDKMLFHMYTKIVICYVMLCYWRIGAWNITGIVSMYTSPSNHLTWHSVVPQPCDRSTARGASVVDRRK